MQKNPVISVRVRLWLFLRFLSVLVVKEAYCCKCFCDCLMVFSIFIQQQWPPVVMLCHHICTHQQSSLVDLWGEALFMHFSWQGNKVGITPSHWTQRGRETTRVTATNGIILEQPGGCRNRGCLLCCARLCAVRGQSLCWDLDESPPFIVSRQCSVVG